MINVTPDALNKIKDLLEKENDKSFLRVGVLGGGCSGLSYNMKFVGSKKENDLVFNFEDVVVICDPKSIKYLKNMTIDYNKKLNGMGFEFKNPNIKKDCSCGASFSV